MYPRNSIVWLLVATATISALLVGAYFWQFRGDFSRDQGDWGTFGDYVGGTLGTVASVAAFIAIMLTLQTQRKQNEMLRQQGELEELQRLLASISATVDEILDRFEPINNSRDTRQYQFVSRPTGQRVRDLIAGIGNNALQSSPQPIPDEIVQRAREISGWLVTELQHLALCLEHYRDSGGSKFVLQHYQLRYQTIVCWLHAVDMVSSPTVVRYFDPDTFKDILKT